MLPFKKGVVVDATEMGTITDLPDSCAIIGGGVIAVEYANVLAGLGVGVSLLCKDEVWAKRRVRVFFLGCCWYLLQCACAKTTRGGRLLENPGRGVFFFSDAESMSRTTEVSTAVKAGARSRSASTSAAVWIRPI